jgi:hypothetical protein
LDEIGVFFPALLFGKEPMFVESKERDRRQRSYRFLYIDRIDGRWYWDQVLSH